MDKDQYRILEKNCRFEMPLQPADNTVFSYGQSEALELVGKFKAHIRSAVTGAVVSSDILVAKNKANSRPILSYQSSMYLGVLHVTHKIASPLAKEDVIKQFPQVFTGIGLHKTIEAKLIIDDSATPVAQ